MDQLDQIVSLIALTMGVGWASGINLYATVLMLGVLSNMAFTRASMVVHTSGGYAFSA